MAIILSNFLIPLILTIIIECIVAFLLGYRNKFTFLAIGAVDLATNPLLNFIVLLVFSLGFKEYLPIVILILEVSVVVVEWGLLLYCVREKRERLLILSAAMNAASYLTGVLIYSH